MTDYTVVAAVDIVAYTAATALCPALSLKVEGSDSDWATEAMTTICSACADLDGYKITAVMSDNFTTPAATVTLVNGGCIATATTASAICINNTYAIAAAVTAAGSAAAADDPAYLDTVKAAWVNTTDFAAAVGATGTAYLSNSGTAITAATNYLTAEPSACTVDTADAAAIADAAVLAACLVAATGSATGRAITT
jgi:hypothetical protein